MALLESRLMQRLDALEHRLEARMQAKDERTTVPQPSSTSSSSLPPGGNENGRRDACSKVEAECSVLDNEVSVASSAPPPSTPAHRDNRSHSAQQLWALVEHDTQTGQMLHDVRKQITLTAAASRFSHSSCGNAATARAPPRISHSSPCVAEEMASRFKSKLRKRPRSRLGKLAAAASPALRLRENTQRRREGLSESMGVSSGSKSSDSPKTSRCSWAGPVLHPESRFRMTWNVLLAALICYCGIVVPFEIAFEEDFVHAMCGYGEASLPRKECPSYLTWFWFNVLVDICFITDIAINCRTGYVRAALHARRRAAVPSPDPHPAAWPRARRAPWVISPHTRLRSPARRNPRASPSARAGGRGRASTQLTHADLRGAGPRGPLRLRRLARPHLLPKAVLFSRRDLVVSAQPLPQPPQP